ncbi:hypothetical protein F5I97DRAFT_356240 [Phlebopus sp. FC_14]|nr:hypothetical protein F5I97DRAFT_356240 [Phlebopus sp. FC_14]
MLEETCLHTSVQHLNIHHAAQLHSSASEHGDSVCNNDGDDQIIPIDGGNAKVSRVSLCRIILMLVMLIQEMERDGSVLDHAREVDTGLVSLEFPRISSFSTTVTPPPTPSSLLQKGYEYSTSITPPPTPSSSRQNGYEFSPSGTPVGKGLCLFGSTPPCPSPAPSEHGSSQPCFTTGNTHDAEKALSYPEVRSISPQSSIGFTESSYYDMR